MIISSLKSSGEGGRGRREGEKKGINGARERRRRRRKLDVGLKLINGEHRGTWD